MNSRISELLIKLFTNVIITILAQFYSFAYFVLEDSQKIKPWTSRSRNMNANNKPIDQHK